MMTSTWPARWGNGRIHVSGEGSVMGHTKAFIHVVIAAALVCLTMLSASRQAQAQTESDTTARKNADLAREVERLVIEKQKLRDEFLQVLRKEIIERRRQLEKARLELAKIQMQEKAMDKGTIPEEAITTLLNKDAVIES